MNPLPYVYDDGGRSAAGYRGRAGDCVVRAIAIATEQAYADVYAALFEATRESEVRNVRRRVDRRGATPRNGVPMPVVHPYLAALGWAWAPTMSIGSGTTIHVAEGELPDGRLVVRCSRHLTAVVYGVVRDTYDPGRLGTRAVYGYWRAS